MDSISKTLVSAFLILSLALFPLFVSAEDGCESGDTGASALDRATALKYKIVAFFSILIAGMLGICLSVFGHKIPALHSKSTFFLFIRMFASGVILATGFVHVFADAAESLTSPCLGDQLPWGDFPMTELIAMVSAILTMMIESFTAGYIKRSQPNKAVESLPVSSEEGQQNNDRHEGHVHAHTLTGHGHAHGFACESEKIINVRQKIVTQVLELGIVVHSIIIGISLGVSNSLDTLKPLLVAISFHQFFEGLGLGGCISQAKFKGGAIAIMTIFFAMTTPVGIGIGIGVAETYDENSPTALLVSGIMNAAAAGILIYMALVDLIAVEFMSPRVQSNLKLQIGSSISLLLGVGAMSLLAIWA